MMKFAHMCKSNALVDSLNLPEKEICTSLAALLHFLVWPSLPSCNLAFGGKGEGGKQRLFKERSKCLSGYHRRGGGRTLLSERKC